MVMLGNLTSVVVKTWKFGTSDYITKSTTSSPCGVHSYEEYGIAAIKLDNKIKLNVFNDIYRNYLDYHTSVW